jgi:hypothetical protein
VHGTMLLRNTRKNPGTWPGRKDQNAVPRGKVRSS